MPNLDRIASAADPSARQVTDVLRAAFDAASKPRAALEQLLEPLLYRRFVVSPLARDVAVVLLDALREPELVRPAEVLEALYAISVGFDGEAALARRIDEPWLAASVGEDFTLRELRAPIVERVADVIPLAVHEQAIVRGAAALLLSALPEHRAAIVPALEGALAGEDEPLARASILFALAVHGIRKEVPDPPPKQPVASILARLVRTLHGGPVDLSVLADARKLPLSVDHLLGPVQPVVALVFAIVGELLRRDEPAALLDVAKGGGGYELVALAALAASWPARRTPMEPRTSVDERDRRWLGPLVATGQVRGNPDVVFARSGIVKGPHLRRLLGQEHGAADVHLDGVPAWLLARRVVDGRAPLDAWLRPLGGRSPEETMAIVIDLGSFRTYEPWPPTGIPDPTPATFEANARFFDLVRATFATLPDAPLERLLEGELDMVQASALATLIGRGRDPYGVHRSRIAALLDWLDAYDVAGLRAIVASLTPERRAEVLLPVRPGVVVDPVEGTVLLTQLWFFADLAPPEVLGTLVDYVTDEMSLDPWLTKAKTPFEAKVTQSKRGALEVVFRRVGTPAVEPIRSALGKQKPKSTARSLLELALAAAEGRPVPIEPPPVRDEKPERTSNSRAKKK